jgi:flagellum-specific peptidoglycan hydrolase FlgJ
MIKRIFLVALLSSFLFGCKAKHKVTYAKKGTETISETPSSKITPKKRIDDGGLYPMPEDTGEFVRLEFTSIGEYIAAFSEVAQLEMKAYGIPASITLAQGLLESGLGKGALAKKTNNHFGIKCHTGWQGDYDFHDDDEKGECFRKYNHPMYSYRDHSLFLKNRSRYAFLFEFKQTDYKKWAKGLKKAGYATDPKYPQKLISLIEKHQLYTYDNKTSQNEKIETRVQPGQNEIYVVRKGDTLYSISRRYLVSVDELKRMNRIKGSSISVGQELTVKSYKINK